MGLLQRLLEGNEWSEEVSETLKVRQEAEAEIARMKARIEEFEDEIIELNFLSEYDPYPERDAINLDIIAINRKAQRFYEDRIRKMEKCIKILDDAIAAFRNTQVN
jgi:hypothetical protein